MLFDLRVRDRSLSSPRQDHRKDVFRQPRLPAPRHQPRTAAFVHYATGMGGAEWSTLYLAERLLPTAWQPLVICPDEGGLAAACRHAGVPVRIVSPAPFLSTSVRIGRRWRLPNPFACAWDLALALRNARRLAVSLREIRPDLVVTKGMFSHIYGGLAARWARLPCIWHAQDFISERFGGVFRACFGLMASALATRVIVDGSSIARQLPHCVQHKIQLLFNAVDVQQFRPGLDGLPSRRELGIPSDAFVIGHAARLTPWKGQHYLLEAFSRIARQHSRAWLLFVGSPVFDTNTYERQLRERTKSLGLTDRVVFAGYRHDLARVLASMNLFAYPSVEKDTTPLALLSAMAAGLPIVAFDIEGVREAIGDEENGLLVPVEQVEALARALVKVLTDDPLRRQLAAQARQRAEGAFSWDCCLRQFERVFHDAVGQATC